MTTVMFYSQLRSIRSEQASVDRVFSVPVSTEYTVPVFHRLLCRGRIRAVPEKHPTELCDRADRMTFGWVKTSETQRSLVWISSTLGKLFCRVTGILLLGLWG